MADILIGGLDPALGRIGELIGLLAPVTPGTGIYTLRTSWFADPVTPIRQMVGDENRGELLALILGFLGSPTPSPLADSASQSWYAIDPKGSTVWSLITEDPTSADSCRLALGAAFAQPDSGNGLTATLRFQLPVVDLASGTLLLAKEPVTVALELEAKDLQSVGQNSLSGIDVTAKLSTNAAPDFDLILRGLKIGTADAKDISLAELAKDPSQLIGAALQGLVTEAIDTATSNPSIQHDLLWLLGLPIQGVKSEVPAPVWSNLTISNFGSFWKTWFQSIVTTPAALKAWMHGVFCLANGFDVTTRQAQRGTDITGTGTDSDPFAAAIIGGGNGEPSLEFTLGAPAAMTLLPGLRVVSAPIAATDAINVQLMASAQLGASLAPAFKVALSAQSSAAGTPPLFAYTDSDPSKNFSPTKFDAGISLANETLAPFAFFTDQSNHTQSLIDLWQEANPTGKTLDWLLDRLQDDDLWEHVFSELLPDDCGLVYQDGVFSFLWETPPSASGSSSSFGLEISLDGAKVTLNLSVDAAFSGLSVPFNASLTFDDITAAKAPTLTFAGSLSPIATGTQPMPKLSVSFDGSALQLGADLVIPGQPQPVHLSLVPFKGISGFSITDVLPLLEGAILGSTSVKQWLNTELVQGAPESTFGNILVDWGLLSNTNGYAFVAANLGTLGPEKLIGKALTRLLSGSTDLKLLTIGTSGGFYLASDSGKYGVRLAVPGLVLGGGTTPPPASKGASPTDDDSDNPSTPAQSTQVTLQLGAWMSGETDGDNNNWLSNSWGATAAPAAGIHLDLVSIDSGGDASFSPGLKLASVGLDVAGTDKNPLFDLNGYRAEGIEGRIYLDISGPTVGGGVRLVKASIPLSPSAEADSDSKDPVASNLLSGGAGPDGDTPANPIFDLQFSYVNQPAGLIVSDANDPIVGDVVWLPVNKSFGPLYCRRVGLGFDFGSGDAELQVGYDGSVALGPLGIDLADLTVGIPLKMPDDLSKYDLHLGGLDVTFDGGPVEVSGAFLKTTDAAGDPEYTGAALIKTDAFTIAGFGSYAVLSGSPSLFIYAVLERDLGGPPFCFVTALALGFGFKRGLILPAVDEVQNFPLVRAIMDPNYVGASIDPKDALQTISNDFPPDPSAYWLAVGVRFSSFELLDTVAVLTVTFGSHITISVLGVTTLSIPSNLDEGQDPICYAELAIRAEYDPEVGALSVLGRLTSNSYVFAKECKLTGGFAFCTWFKDQTQGGDNISAGDFVFTLGGYHPRFVPPSHYPVVPRVAINWSVSDSVKVTGELYYALTPSCLMAGGKLSAVYDGGWVKAWFVAYADFLISWKPFHYDIAIGVDLGASATVSVNLGVCTVSMTISFDIGADLHLWGPPFAGVAHISFYIVSFTVSFGDQDQPPPKPLDWKQFSDSFLPAVPPPPSQPPSAAKIAFNVANATPSAASNTNPPSRPVCSVTFTGGLIRQWNDPDNNGDTVAIINGHELALNAQTKVPCTGIVWQNGGEFKGSDASATKLGVKPMYSSALVSTLTVSIGRKPTKDDRNPPPLDSSLFTATLITTGFPEALWGQGQPSFSAPTNTLLQEVPAGIAIVLSESAKEGKLLHPLPEMDLEAFAYDEKDLPSTWSAPTPFQWVTDNGLASALRGDGAVAQTRSDILAALADVTNYPLNDVSLLQTAAQAATIFQSLPVYAPLGQSLASGRIPR